ncbi:MAG: nuclear transport factor 2 family protein [Myxococcota bacterium]
MRGSGRDQPEISQCLQSYGQALDERAFDLFDTVFTPDARIRYEILGRVTDVRMFELKASLIATHVQVRLDGTRSSWVLYGTYRDRLVRSGAGWRIRERHLHGVYGEGELLPRKLVKTFTSAPAPAGE